ncbi:MAG: ATP-binding protein [Bacteroidota bacterium]
MPARRSHTASKSKWYLTIRGKSFLTFSLLVAFFSVFILIYLPARLRSQALNSIEEKVETLGEFMAFNLSPTLVFEDPETAEEALEGAHQNPNFVYAIVLDQAGQQFAGFGKEKAEEQHYATAAPGLSADRQHYLLDVPITHDGREIGRLYLAHSLSEMKKAIAVSQAWIAVISVIFLVLGILFVFLVTQVLTRNLRNIVSVIRQTGDGDFTQRAAVASRDETGILADRFNQMLQNLENFTTALRSSELQYRSLAENMTEGLVQIGPGMKITYANPRFCKMFAYTESEVLNRSIYDIIGLSAEKAAANQLFEPEEEEQVEIRLVDREGKDRWVLVSSTIDDTEGQGKRITAIFTDITRLKQTESDLRYKNRELDTFVYKASHDLKAPLSSLRGLTDIAKGEANEGDSVGTYLDLIMTTIDKMDQVLLGLLEVTWIKQGSLEYVEMELETLVELVLGAISHAPGYESVKFTLEIPVGFVVKTDMKLMNSILQNLIFNAVKYHREEGDDKWVKISASRSARTTFIAVEDNGPGIPVEARDRLFDMFFRASLKSKGSGLGLYIVRNSVEKMGGMVRLKSQVGVGTEFIVEIPNAPVVEEDV